MNTADAHRKAQTKAQQAKVIMARGGDSKSARRLFSEAADLELVALDGVDQVAMSRTFGIVAVSAIALLYKAGRADDVVRHGQRLLGTLSISEWARRQIAEMVDEPRIDG